MCLGGEPVFETTDDGHCRVDRLDCGIHTLTFVVDGLRAQVVTFDAAVGTVSRVDAELST